MYCLTDAVYWLKGAKLRRNGSFNGGENEANRANLSKII